MEKLVSIDLRGECDKGFSVTLRIEENGEATGGKSKGNLPPALVLFETYKSWQSSYRRQEYSFRLKDRVSYSIKVQANGQNSSLLEIDNYLERQKQECLKEAEELSEKLNEWLNYSEFSPVVQKIKEELDPSDKIRIIIHTTSERIKKLPWNCWNLLREYPKAEIAIATREGKKNPIPRNLSNEIKILCIIGNSKGINIPQYREELLKNLSNAKITFLEEPQREELNDALWQQSWDILFFAGHSRTEGQRGRLDVHLDINHGHSLRIDEIKSAIRKAIVGGLQLAIFNCSDGFALACELDRLNVPQLLVMREPLPDLVAQKFLSHFLIRFAKGATLYEAARAARENLQSLEHEFTCASWLPVIYQNPAATPFTWNSLLNKELIEKTSASLVEVKEDVLSKAGALDRSEIEQPNGKSFTSLTEENFSKLEIVNNLEQELYLSHNDSDSLKVEIEPEREKELLSSLKNDRPESEDNEAESDEDSSFEIVYDNQPSESKKLPLVSLGITASIAAIGVLAFLTQLKPNVTISQIEDGSQTLPASSQFKQVSAVSLGTDRPKTVSTFENVQNVPSGLFDYGGSTAWATIRAEVDPVIQSALPEFKLRYVQHSTRLPGSSSGISMLIDEQKTFAQSSRPLRDSEYQKAKEKGFSIEEIPVAIDGIAIAVHPNLKVPGLTLAQLKNIYLGKITNWKEVGGPNLKITPYSRPIAEDGTVEFFIEEVLNEQNFGKQVQFIDTTTQAIRTVSSNPGGIYFTSATKIIEQCRIKPLPLGNTSSKLVAPYIGPLVSPQSCPERRNQFNRDAFHDGSYPLTRSLYVIVKQNGQIEEKVGNAYASLLLSDRGQQLIEKAGFVSIRK